MTKTATNRRYKPSEETKKRIATKEKMNLLFKEKGIISILDKRRIYKEVFGDIKKVSKLEDIEQVIAYLHANTSEELKSPLIGWLVVSDKNEGMSKQQIRRLMSEIPSAFGIEPISFHHNEEEVESLSIYGYVHHVFYRKNEEAIKAAFRSIRLNELEGHAMDLYTLDEDFNLASFARFEPSEDEKQEMAKEKEQQKAERIAYMERRMAEKNKS